MENRDKRHRVTITVSDSELDALEDSLIVWSLCKKHNARTFDFETGKARTSQEIFKMQDECKMCQRQKKLSLRLSENLLKSSLLGDFRFGFPNLGLSP